MYVYRDGEYDLPGWSGDLTLAKYFGFESGFLNSRYPSLPEFLTDKKTCASKRKDTHNKSLITSCFLSFSIDQ